MAAPSHLHLHLPGCPQTLALLLPSPRGFSARPVLRSRSHRPRLRPVAALGPADAGDLLGRVEAFLYTVADAAVSAEPVAAAADGGTKEAAGDWLSGITNSMETVLKVLKDGLSALHVPYSYGFAIILLTVLVKAATFPLTKKQVESALAMRSLQPQVKAIQERYAGDQERIQLETARLYKLSGVNPVAGCLPTLVTIPVWIGLYRALSNVANEDGHPPLGWSDSLAYLVLPVLLVMSQYISTQVMQPPQSNDPSQQGAQAVTKFLPLLIGYFALSVPSGLGLYWLTNNILSTAQQVWLQKLGGAKNPVKEYIDKLSREESTTVQKNESTVQSEPLPKLSKPQPSQEPKPSGPQRGERFRKLKEEESRRTEVLGQAKQSEQSSSESSFLDETQNSDASSGDKKNQQESHENGPIVTNSNGGVNHSRNEKAQNLSSEKEAADDHSSVSKPVSPDAHKLTDRENGNDAV
ncbi:ALBINO3-like protein 1, chloroplastic isoform X2 [Miscanthus floridulus]|uniref:ALBINO3-like protein 1, chloroplastic isoform X2 n=1 Tax=Miscanthus floridulus TaxID=154761 RepID=UPI00345A6226